MRSNDPKLMNLNRTTRHVIIKLSKIKDKDRILSIVRGKREVLYKGTLISYQQISQQKIFQAKREWGAIYKILKEKEKLLTENTIPGKAIHQKQRKNKYFSKQKLRKFVTRPALQKMLMGVI